MATGIETHEGRPTRWLAVAFIALLLALGWLAGADDAVGSLRPARSAIAAARSAAP